MSQDLQLKIAVELELRRRNLSFTDWLQDISPQYIWDVPHLAYMRNYIDRIIAGESLQIMFLMPPRHGKSLQNTIHLSAFYLWKFPNEPVIIGAYNQDLANQFSRESKKLALKCTALAHDKKTINEWQTAEGGILKAVGVNVGITGRGGKLILIDDPIKNREEAYSKVYRDKVWRWYTTDLYTRKEPHASIILTMTLWHHDDLVHRILTSDDVKNWIVIKIPAIAKDDDILGRLKGEALWPARYPIDELLNIKSVLGSDFDALYQLEPIISEGNIIKREWFIEKPLEDFPVRWDFIGQYYDTAFKKGQQNDYSVCLTIGKLRDQIYILNIFRDKLDFPELKDMMVTLAAEYKATFIGVEDKASGQSLIQEMANNSNLPVKPEPIKVSTDKESRANAITPYMRDKKLIMPKGAHWIDDFLDEVCTFPGAPHDDQVDALTMALNHQRDSGYNLLTLIGA